MIRVLGVVLLMMFVFGFRVWLPERWDISEASPTVWVKICDGSKGKTFPEREIPDNDVLYGENPTLEEAAQTVLDDINSIPSAYVQLELYPDDVNNPAADSEFTTELAAKRTIEVCDEGVQFPRGGEAIPDFDGNTISECVINMQDFEEMREFVLTLGHELGHCLGLDHPQETINAVMSYYVDRDVSVRYQIDDMMGITHLYPNDSGKAKEKMGFGIGCGKKF